MWIKLNTKLLALSFILFSCFISAEENPKDPYEGFNRGVYTFNDTIDGAILKPIAMGYNYVTPDVAKKGINNFYNNITDFITAVNSFLQLDFEQGILSRCRLHHAADYLPDERSKLLLRGEGSRIVEFHWCFMRSIDSSILDC